VIELEIVVVPKLAAERLGYIKWTRPNLEGRASRSTGLNPIADLICEIAVKHKTCTTGLLDLAKHIRNQELKGPQ
jgi:hypothetical protein